MARDIGIKPQTLLKRINSGMSVEEALIKPVINLYFYNGLNLTLADWAIRTNISQDVLWYRIVKAGWSVEKALITPLSNKHTNLGMEPLEIV